MAAAHNPAIGQAFGSPVGRSSGWWRRRPPQLSRGDGCHGNDAAGTRFFRVPPRPGESNRSRLRPRSHCWSKPTGVASGMGQRPLLTRGYILTHSRPSSRPTGSSTTDFQHRGSSAMQPAQARPRSMPSSGPNPLRRHHMSSAGWRPHTERASPC